MPASKLQRFDFTPAPAAGASHVDAEDILETLEPVYEHAVWLADMGAVDFDPFAPLADLIARLRAERPE